MNSFDVSTGVPALLQTNRDTSSMQGTDLVLTPDGQHICVPVPDGNDGSAGGTAFYDTADLNESAGTFQSGGSEGPIAFSPDNSTAYEFHALPVLIKEFEPSLFGLLEEFDTSSFALLDSAPLPYSVPEGVFAVSDIAVDNTGSYVFVSEAYPADRVTILYTGHGPMQPSTLAALVSVTAVKPEFTGEQTAKFRLLRTGDTSQPLSVYYQMKFSAPYIGNYDKLNAEVTFPAGESIVAVTLPPTRLSASLPVTVKLTLTPEPDYVVVKPVKAKTILLN